MVGKWEKVKRPTSVDWGVDWSRGINDLYRLLSSLKKQVRFLI
jgi:hypothetical protein